MKILEYSSDGDKRFSAFYAKVTIFGTTASIERHYQSCKKKYDKNGIFVIDCKKGEKPEFIRIYNHRLDIKYLTPYYKLLWWLYLENNPDLVEYASQYDDFHDRFKGRNTKNCQADVIRQYIKEGSESVLEDCKELLEVLKII